MRSTRVCEILENFKHICRDSQWGTAKGEDWIEINGNYHSFLWIRDIHVSSFKRIVTNRKCVVRQGSSYSIVEASRIAWLFSSPPSEALVKTIAENPEFHSRVAVYDLSPLLKGKNLCTRMNHTDSPVFQEFESFLKNKLGIDLEQFSSITNPGLDFEDCAIAETA